MNQTYKIRKCGHGNWVDYLFFFFTWLLHLKWSPFSFNELLRVPFPFASCYLPFCSFLFHYNWELSLSRSLFPLFQMYPYWACPVRWCHGYWDLDYLAAALEMWGNKTKDYVTVSTLDEYYRDLHINTNWFTSIVSVCLYWQGQRGAYSWVVTACTAFHIPIKLHLNRVRNPPPFQGVLLFAMLHDNDFIAVGQ